MGLSPLPTFSKKKIIKPEAKIGTLADSMGENK
jgi:hypothetical protein